jgi:hypothetical protein
VRSRCGRQDREREDGEEEEHTLRPGGPRVLQRRTRPRPFPPSASALQRLPPHPRRRSPFLHFEDVLRICRPATRIAARSLLIKLIMLRTLYRFKFRAHARRPGRHSDASTFQLRMDLFLSIYLPRLPRDTGRPARAALRASTRLCTTRPTPTIFCPLASVRPPRFLTFRADTESQKLHPLPTSSRRTSLHAAAVRAFRARCRHGAARGHKRRVRA